MISEMLHFLRIDGLTKCGMQGMSGILHNTEQFPQRLVLTLE